MKQLSPEELKQNYDTFVTLINKYLAPERRTAVLKMISNFEEELVTGPASGKNWYHGAYPGGYLVHILKVVQMAFRLKKAFESQGGKIDFSDEELMFVCLFHDLGKLGNGEQPGYLPQESEWHRKNQGSIYVNNPELNFMLVQDRSLFLLQKYGVAVSENEYIAIKIHDGLFDDTNKPYWLSFAESSRLRSNLARILHTADLLAATAEYDLEHQEDD